MKNYFIDCVNGPIGNSEFSLDHLPPESVGGKYKVITCKQCNNNAGSYEAELIKLLDFGTIPGKHDSLFPKAKIGVKSSIERFDVSISKYGNSMNLDFHPAARKFNPKLIDFIKDLHNGKLSELTVTGPFPDEEKISKALLKSAYLMGFVWWGYNFVFSQSAQKIRQVLEGKLEYPTRVPTVWVDSHKHNLQKGVGVFTKPIGIDCYYASMEMKSSSNNCTAMVVLPNLTMKGWDKLHELGAFLKANPKGYPFEFMTLPRNISYAC
jgi:hypothetical protein